MNPITTKIAGIPHRNPDLSVLKVGDEVQLIPEPDNKFDPNAIKVMHNGVHLGYIPRTDTGFAKDFPTLFIMEVVPSRKWDEVKLASYK